MSTAEIWALTASAVTALLIWITWYRRLAAFALRCSPRRERWLLAVTPLACGGLLWIVLSRWSSADVRDDWFYLGFYLAMGAAWIGLGTELLPYLGLSPRDDVLERRNSAAGIAIAGALLGLTFCFAGGNVGDGPGWWVVFFCAVLATAVYTLLWFVLDRLTGLADSISIDRDTAAGFRLAGFFLGSGLILGRAVAGTWVSAGGTLVDFVRLGWPVLPLWTLVAVLERGLRPSATEPARPVLRDGVLPAILYATAGLLVLLHAGPPW
jgi:uncharacterized membrane protein YjfL (UPF0719 family)